MIREANNLDVDRINELGLLLHDNFITLFDIKNILNTSYSRIFVYEEENIIKGFIHVESHFEVLDIINIIVDPNYRRKGIASKLISFVINNFECEKILLEVNSKNVEAYNLYKKFNFNEINIRKKYYGDNDAIVMEMIK